ncbi:hypothetical protein KJ885_00790 [Patescibacteria group bacterium]|nr:hypothetical protein [Patescibacteria group bacterium]
MTKLDKKIIETIRSANNGYGLQSIGWISGATGCKNYSFLLGRINYLIRKKKLRIVDFGKLYELRAV